MGAWHSWIHHPQNLRFRKVLFWVHRWLAIVCGLYVVLISVSGSMIVYQREIARKFRRGPALVVPRAHRLSLEELQQIAERDYPGYEIDNFSEPSQPNQPITVVMERKNQRRALLFDPYTGADLGDSRSGVERAVGWLVSLHRDLLLGSLGRLLNGIGSAVVTLIAFTGVVIWWPGVKNWRRSLWVHRNVQFVRFNWDLHSAIGFWCSLPILIWGLSGIYFTFPTVFLSALAHLDPQNRHADPILRWLTDLHIGRFNAGTELIWTIAGLTPAGLAITGILMWWYRAVQKRGG